MLYARTFYCYAVLAAIGGCMISLPNKVDLLASLIALEIMAHPFESSDNYLMGDYIRDNWDEKWCTMSL